MMSVNKLNTSNSNVLNTSPSKVSGSSKSPTKSPSKILKPGKKPVAEVESPLQKNPHSNTMRQVHVNLKPKKMERLSDDEKVANLVMDEKRDEGLLKPIRTSSYDKEKGSSAASSNDSVLSETIAINYEEITQGYDLKGEDRVNELIAFSEEVSTRIGETIRKCERIEEQAHYMLGSGKIMDRRDY